MQTFTSGCTPPEVIKQAAKEQCPQGYHMTIKRQAQWSVLSSAWNKGIDAHLEALGRSTADHNTGKVMIHPEEIHVLCRRLTEIGNEEADNMRSVILETLGIEEV